MLALVKVLREKLKDKQRLKNALHQPKTATQHSFATLFHTFLENCAEISYYLIRCVLLKKTFENSIGRLSKFS